MQIEHDGQSMKPILGHASTREVAPNDA